MKNVNNVKIGKVQPQGVKGRIHCEIFISEYFMKN